MIWHHHCMLGTMTVFSGQILLFGTAICAGFDPRVAKGARCTMICVCDCDTLEALGQMANYETDGGLDAGRMLDDTLGQTGWNDITISRCLPVADTESGWEPELADLIASARRSGIAHMILEASAKPTRAVH
jgi:hypothetical protein